MHPVTGVPAKRGDFEPLISEDLFYRVQGVLSGRVPSTTPQQRAHPDFQLPAFVRCAFCGCGLTESAVFVRELHGDDQLPGSMLCGVMAAAGVVPLDAR